MAVATHVVLRNVTPEQYDAVRTEAGWLTEAPVGGMSHVTWWEGNDCHNLDAWESEEAFGAFGEQRLGPAMARAGVAAEPEVTFHPAHEVYTLRRAVVTRTPEPLPGDNAALIRGGYDAFAAGDIPTVLALFDPNITWYSPDTIRFGGTYVGAAAVGEFFSHLPENYRELHVQPDSFIDSGDTVVVLGHHHGRSIAGTEFNLAFVHVWTFRDGKPVSFTEHFDTVRMNAALGLAAPATTSV